MPPVGTDGLNIPLDRHRAILGVLPTRFTIAIPTHDRRETALLALRSALCQTRPPEQVLVLCDGCSDGTEAAIRELGNSTVEVVELAKSTGYGYEHRNRSLELAACDAIIWLADDDLLVPDHLERIGELWDTGHFDLVQCDGVVVHPDDTLEWFGSDWSVPYSRERLEAMNSNPMSSISLRVDVAQAIGGWDASLRREADWDLWRRALAAGARSARSPEPTVLHFRASGREQAWPLRVRQNAAWLSRLEDPVSLLEARVVLRRAGAELDAIVAGRVAELEHHASVLEQEFEGAQLELDAARRALQESNERAAQLDAVRAAAEANAARLQTTLSRIYGGGWWQLRQRVTPLMRLLGRGG